MHLRWTLLSLACLGACATASFEGTPIADWAGAYGNEAPIVRETVPDDSRKTFIPTFYGVVENVLEIRPRGPTRARVDIRLYYPRGHQCGVTAEADLTDGKLVLDANSEDGPCQLFVAREKNRDGEEVLAIRENREFSKACYIYCGANARLSASIPVSTRHALPATPVTELDE